jgi:hypothetical protein
MEAVSFRCVLHGDLHKIVECYTAGIDGSCRLVSSSNPAQHRKLRGTITSMAGAIGQNFSAPSRKVVCNHMTFQPTIHYFLLPT